MQLIGRLVSNSQLTAQLARTAHRTERARYVRLELINHSGVSHRAFLVVKTKQQEMHCIGKFKGSSNNF